MRPEVREEGASLAPRILAREAGGWGYHPPRQRTRERNYTGYSGYAEVKATRSIQV